MILSEVREITTTIREGRRAYIWETRSHRIISGEIDGSGNRKKSQKNTTLGKA